MKGTYENLKSVALPPKLKLLWLLTWPFPATRGPMFLISKICLAYSSSAYFGVVGRIILLGE